MHIRPFYAYQKGVLPDRFCDRVIEAGNQLPHDLIGGIGQDRVRVNREKRDTELAFFPVKQTYNWVYETIWSCVHAANSAYWDFRLKTVEPAQYGVYNTRQFYDWHMDQHPKPYADEPFKGLVRKLSFTMQLSDESDYDGGEFELREPGEENLVQRIEGIRARGSVIVFPSFIYHRVTPVTRGVRRSLVGWVVGPPFV